MEYAKDEIFSIRYNKKKDKLEYPFYRKAIKRVINNKFITILILMGVLFSVFNFILIYMFFDILSKI